MSGFVFTKYAPAQDNRSTFEKLLDLFLQLMVYTAGDVSEALNWMNQLDQKHRITTPDYGMGDFIEDLKKHGYIKDDGQGRGIMIPTSKSGQSIRKRSLEEIFGKLKKAGRGNHRSNFSGEGEESNEERRPFQWGDSLDQIAMTESLRNAQIQHGLGDFMLTENDLEVQEKDYNTQTSTVLMIDISHSMILYGEDRITPAKKVAMALSELITTRYKKDSLDIIVFGNDAWKIEIKDLPYLTVGPYHTNTVAGLELAIDILRKRKTPNKQIFMITDGKPSCLKIKGKYYKNSFGLDRKIVNKTLNLAASCRRMNIDITTFMVAQDPYLQKFVQDFTKANNGKAFYTDLDGLGEYVFEDYERNRKRRMR